MLIQTEYLRGDEWAVIGTAPAGTAGTIRDYTPDGGETLYIAQVDPETSRGEVLLTVCGVIIDNQPDALDAELLATLEVGEAHELLIRPSSSHGYALVRFRCLES